MSFYVTTPIYYVNAVPHLGHAYSTIGADVLARHMRARGEDVFFLTGTDEHGEPVAQAAEAEGVTPRELADRNAERFQALMPRLNVTNDFFIRTSDPRHMERVQQVMQRIHDNGHTYKDAYVGWYCPRCADFKTEQEIAEGNTCPIHHIPLERHEEENWFFRLSAFQERLEALYSDNPTWAMPKSRFNEARAFITGGLQDISLSRNREKLSWGVGVPWDSDHVFYVWFDALLNYYTALGFAREGEDLTERFWPCTVHVMAKDILKFHAVIWPAMLMAAEIELPEHVFIHGYLLMDGEKMSKSLGNVLDPFTIMETFGTDALRFYLMRAVAFGQDGAVSTTDFESRYETELANDYGNLVSRVIAMVHRYREGHVPAADDPCAQLPAAVASAFDDLEISVALDTIWTEVRGLNRYVEEQAPWTLAKDPEQAQKLDDVLGRLIRGITTVTEQLAPFIPESADKVLAALAQDPIEKIPPLFPKHDK